MIRFLLLLLLPSVIYSQGKYIMYSDIWKVEGGKMVVIDERYSIDDLDSLKKNFDISKTRSYLIEAFNEFRKDYGSPMVVEDATLSLRCQSYSKRLIFDFRHDPKAKPECIGTFNINCLAPIVRSGEDFNMAVAEYIFDLFVVSNDHMSILLNKYYLHYGFGVTVEDGSMYVVIRCF